MDSDYLPNSSREIIDFGFAFNDSNFSDRVLHIEIISDSPEIRSDGEGYSSLADWARHWKRSREDLNKEIALDYAGCHEEFFHAEQSDIHNVV